MPDICADHQRLRQVWMVTVNQMNLFSMFERPPLEEWTFEDLTAWANTVMPGWKESTWASERALSIKRSKCEIIVHLGHFAKSWKGGIACIHFDAQDARNGFSGMGYASENIEEVERSILKKAAEFWG